MEIATAITIGKSFLELSTEIANVIKKAQNNPDVERRILYYLDAAQTSVAALGIERQKILTDARKCDVRKKEEIDALWQRLDRYLNEYNISPHLERAIKGLGECEEAISKKAHGAWLHKHDKEAAVETFKNTLSDLKSLLEKLDDNFYIGSGIGIRTLRPIEELIRKVRDDFMSGHSQNSDVDQEKLGYLVLQALRDDSNVEWIHKNAEIEALVTKLNLAFAVKIDNRTET